MGGGTDVTGAVRGAEGNGRPIAPGRDALRAELWGDHVAAVRRRYGKIGGGGGTDTQTHGKETRWAPPTITPLPVEEIGDFF